MRLRRHGDQGAICELVERHGAMVWSICRQVLCRQQDAEDAYQATLLILTKRVRAIRANDSAAGWLYRVALRTALATRRRAAQRREESLDNEPIGPAEEPFPDIQRRQTAAILMQELRALPDKYQTPLVLRYLEGLSRRAIAEQTDSTIATVQGQLARGKRLLRSRLVRRGVSLAAAMGVVSAAGSASASGLSSATRVGRTPPPIDPTLPLSAASSAVTQLVAQGVRSMMFASIAKPAGAVAGAMVLVVAAVAVEPEKEALPSVTANAEASLQLLSEAPAEAAEGSAPVEVAMKPEKASNRQQNPSQGTGSISGGVGRGGGFGEAKSTRQTGRMDMQGGMSAQFGNTQGAFGGTMRGDTATSTLDAVGRVSSESNTLGARHPQQGAVTRPAAFTVDLAADSQDNSGKVEANLLGHYLKQARREQGDFSEPNFRELQLLRDHWITKREISRKQTELSAKQIEHMNKHGADQQLIEEKKLEQMHQSGEVLMASAKVLEYERLLKQKALASEPPKPATSYPRPAGSWQPAPVPGVTQAWPGPQPQVQIGQPLNVDTDAVIKTIQKELNERLRPSPMLDVDGDYGPLTSDAVKRFQKQMKLPASGVADPPTRVALGIAASPEDIPQPPRLPQLQPVSPVPGVGVAPVPVGHPIATPSIPAQPQQPVQQPILPPRVGGISPVPSHASSPRLKITKILSKGDYNDEVKQLQLALNERLSPSPKLSIDGDFGNRTLAAVKSLQRESNLTVNGVADPRTVAALMEMKPVSKQVRTQEENERLRKQLEARQKSFEQQVEQLQESKKQIEASDKQMQQVRSHAAVLQSYVEQFKQRVAKGEPADIAKDDRVKKQVDQLRAKLNQFVQRDSQPAADPIVLRGTKEAVTQVLSALEQEKLQTQEAERQLKQVRLQLEQVRAQAEAEQKTRIAEVEKIQQLVAKAKSGALGQNKELHRQVEQLTAKLKKFADPDSKYPDRGIMLKGEEAPQLRELLAARARETELLKQLQTAEKEVSKAKQAAQQLQQQRSQLEAAQDQLREAKAQIEKAQQTQQRAEQRRREDKPDDLKPGDQLNVEVQIDGGQFNSSSMDKTVTIEAGGTIALGARYGRVNVAGKSLEEIEKLVEMQIAKKLAVRAQRQGQETTYHFEVQVTRVKLRMFPQSHAFRTE